jgi:hypothetical protein
MYFIAGLVVGSAIGFIFREAAEPSARMIDASS